MDEGTPGSAPAGSPRSRQSEAITVAAAAATVTMANSNQCGEAIRHTKLFDRTERTLLG